MLKFHHPSTNTKVAEFIPGSEIITDPDDLLDIMADAGYHDSNKIVIHEESLPEDFFNLKIP